MQMEKKMEMMNDRGVSAMRKVMVEWSHVTTKRYGSHFPQSITVLYFSVPMNGSIGHVLV